MTTPPEVLKQAVFDIVVEGAAKMERRCKGPLGNCAYRDGQGGACFVGLLLSDDEAIDQDSGKVIDGPVRELHISGRLPERLHVHIALLSDLQWVHDSRANWTHFGDGPPNAPLMREELAAIAVRNGLNTKSVEEHFPA